MPKKRRSTKSRIIKAAWSLFYKNGYDATTVEDIITASKTSKGTFYHYFKSKEGLQQIMQDAIDSGEFSGTSTAEELMNIYAMYERALLYDWSLFKGKYSLSTYSGRLLPHVLNQFKEGI